jgi:hypothetical protein
VHRSLREIGIFLQPKRERLLRFNVSLEDSVLEMLDRSPAASVRNVSDRVGAIRMKMWSTIQDVGLYPIHVQTLKALQPTDYMLRAEFCRCLVGNQQFHTNILFTDEATLNKDGID